MAPTRVTKATQNQDSISSTLLTDLRSEVYALSALGANIALTVKWKGQTWELDTGAAWTPKSDNVAQVPKSSTDRDKESIISESSLPGTAVPSLPSRSSASQGSVDSSAPSKDPQVQATRPESPRQQPLSRAVAKPIRISSADIEVLKHNWFD